MDLSKLKLTKAETGATMQVLHPVTLEPIEGMTINTLGRDSQVYKKITMARQQAALDRMAKGRNAEKLNAEKLAKDTVEDYAKLITGWTGFELNGKELECNKENIISIFENAEFAWLAEQYQEYLAERSNFLDA